MKSQIQEMIDWLTELQSQGEDTVFGIIYARPESIEWANVPNLPKEYWEEVCNRTYEHLASLPVTISDVLERYFNSAVALYQRTQMSEAEENGEAKTD